MSLAENLAARVRAAADDLPVGQLAVAVQRLRAATELLIWVRQESADPLAVPQLTGATEHAEQAGHAMRVAAQSVDDYLAAIGFGAGPAAGGDSGWRAALDGDQEPTAAPGGRAGAPAAPELGNWWAARVAELTDRESAGVWPGPDAATDTTRPAAATDTPELLRRVATAVRREDRAGLHRDLAAVAAPTGLNLAAITPPLLHRLAGDLLDHEPQAEDLRQLASATTRRVRELLPGMPDPVLQTLLARICRVPADERRDDGRRADGDQAGQPPDPPHPADSAVAGAVLTGVLLRLLDREPQTLRPEQPRPLRGRDA
ncbi:hypothetical protein [Solwaraspora sp. WMMA2065]|uniref:hypothetical protein n=1 Tax=Solwaraspora sp. WMMA2065 TaxID=3015166 RepID=UPI00259B1B0A|nr:hypothetical protein [Solwaraspora sp. WMMA2065]WJK35954.1 hypothetical protein O7610_06265 [Solwaraspora sp. WMMA2065]